MCVVCECGLCAVAYTDETLGVNSEVYRSVENKKIKKKKKQHNVSYICV